MNNTNDGYYQNVPPNMQNAPFTGGPNNGYPYINNNFPYINDAKTKLKKQGNIVGTCVLIFIFFQFLLGAFLKLFNVFDLYINNYTFSTCVEMVYSVLFLFVPFAIASLIIKKDQPINNLGFDPPKSKNVFLLAIPAGLMLCFAGDFVSTFISNLFASIGITLSSSPAETVPTSGVELFLFAFSTIVVPCIIEEFAMRGVAMQPLRKYGDAFAITATAVIFGLMHMNAVQGIFAFIAGLVFGYIAIVTGSVWASVIVHALNNAFYVAVNYLSEQNSAIGDKFYNVSVVIIFIIGIVCLVLLLFNKNKNKLLKTPNLTAGMKASSFFTTVPMVIAVLFMLIYTIFA